MVDEVSRYGVHWAPGKIAFLHQTRGAGNAVGLKEISPFFVRLKRRWLCNHLIALNANNPARTHLDRFHDIVQKNSLVRFMLPLPKDADTETQGGVALSYVQDTVQIATLLKMSSPIRMPIFTVAMTSPRTILEELSMTDVQPVVLAGVKAKHTEMVTELARASVHLPRRLLILAASDVPLGVQVLDADHLYRQDQVDLTGLPWESLGAITLRAYMRSEWTGSWFTREPIPANEIKERHT